MYTVRHGAAVLAQVETQEEGVALVKERLQAEAGQYAVIFEADPKPELIELTVQIKAE